MTTFRTLLISLPTGNSTMRMRLWRALKDTGCGVLRDGVYVLPSSAPQAGALTDAAADVKAAGGFAMTANLTPDNSDQLEYVQKLFERSKEYGALVSRINAARSSLPRLGKRKADTLVQRLRRFFEELSAIDFYPGEPRAQTKEALSNLEQVFRNIDSPGEPRSAEGTLRRLDPLKYRNRTWATRKDLWVDRLASVWLIRRFIDNKAKFLWLDRPRDRPKRAIGFDYDGAEFTHVDGHVTYETLMASFGLAGDTALAAIGAVIHFLDVGGIPAADAKGLEMILTGIKAQSRSDDELAAEAGKVFDICYSAYARRTPAAAPATS